MGMFDGVHLGHQVVLESALREAKLLKVPSVVVSFSNHPQQLLSKTPSLQLSTLEQRISVFKTMGFDIALIMEFTPELMNLYADEFIETILINQLNINSISVGYDHCFGKDRQGDGFLLQQYGQKYDFRAIVINPVRLNTDQKNTHDIISSTLIRKLLAFGDIEQASAMLGRPFQVSGIVAQGHQRGRQIGFPTANIQTSNLTLLPPVGTYGGFAKIEVETNLYQWVPAVCNIGTAPTFKDKHPKKQVEVHCLEFPENLELYGKNLTFAFTHHLRAEQQFNSVEDLIRQIGIDCDTFSKTLDNNRNQWKTLFQTL